MSWNHQGQKSVKLSFIHDGTTFLIKFNGEKIDTTSLAELIWSDKTFIKNFRRRRDDSLTKKDEEMDAFIKTNAFRYSFMADEISCSCDVAERLFSMWCQQRNENCKQQMERFFASSLWQKVKTVYTDYNNNAKHREMAEFFEKAKSLYSQLPLKEIFKAKYIQFAKICDDFERQITNDNVVISEQSTSNVDNSAKKRKISKNDDDS